MCDGKPAGVQEDEAVDDYDVDHCLEQLHAAGWSVGDTAFVTEAGTLSWLVYGTNGENVVQGKGETRAALRVYTEDELPANWALTQHYLRLAREFLGELDAPDGPA
jgi:hypothetical protein